MEATKVKSRSAGPGTSIKLQKNENALNLM
jgi:hypothetical protein